MTNTPTTLDTLAIRVSNGSEVNQLGQFCLYLVTSVDEEVDGAAGILSPVSNSVDYLLKGHLDAAVDMVTALYSGVIPEIAEWEIDPSGQLDTSCSSDGRDNWGHWTVARISYPHRRLRPSR